jgi:hypothetical protein
MQFDPDFADPTEWARMYRGHGFQVVPAMSHRENKLQWKRPALPKWRALEHELAPELTFERWYGEGGEHSRRNNMGVIAGACSGGIFVVDLDVHKHDGATGWWLEMRDQQTKAGQLETVEQVTGGGGVQLFFRAPDGWTPPTCKTSIGVDIRGQGGFAMMPPSMHESGTPYRWKAGHEPWEMEVADAPQWLCDAITELAQKFGGASGVNPLTGQREVTSSPAHSTNAFGLIIDGREDYMTRVVWAAVVDLRRDAPFFPAPSEIQTSMVDAFENYARNVKSRIYSPGVPNVELLEREGRGLSLFTDKWQAAMDQWDGKVAAASGVAKPARPFAGEPTTVRGYDFDPETGELTAILTPAPGAAPEAGKADPNALEILDIDAMRLLPKPVYLIEGLAIEEALGFVFGPPGCGKSFLTIGMALSIAASVGQWFGRDIKKHGPVIYISSEGTGDMVNRIDAWEREAGVKVSGLPFYLIRQSVNFMLPSDVDRVVKAVAAVAQLTGQTPVAIFVDTVSRVLPGADENLQKDMTLFIAACDILRNTFHATVIGVHHTSRAGNLRGSTVFDGAGDFLLGIEREEGESVGQLKAKKIKSAKDGWTQPFELKDVTINDATGEGSLVAIPCETVEKKASAWPPREACKRILQAISTAWHSGKPWSPYPQTRKQGRYAVAIIKQQFDVSEKVAESMIDTWLNNEVLSYEMADKHAKMQGLKVTGSIE